MDGSFLQAFALGILSQETWYQRPDRRSAAFLEARSPENTIIFLVSLAQLVMLALVFDSRDLHRKVSAHEIAVFAVHGWLTHRSSLTSQASPEPIQQILSVTMLMASVTSELMSLDLNQDTMLVINTAASAVALICYNHALLALKVGQMHSLSQLGS